MKITSRQAERLAVLSHRQLSPHLENCCLRLSANVAYGQAANDVASLYLTPSLKSKLKSFAATCANIATESSIMAIISASKSAQLAWGPLNLPSSKLVAESKSQGHSGTRRMCLKSWRTDVLTSMVSSAFKGDMLPMSRLQGTLTLKEAVVARSRSRAGGFVLATNVLESQALSEEAMLCEYKEQQSTERGFRFLKDPLFLRTRVANSVRHRELSVTSSVFLKTPKRVAALAMVMGLCLLVYTLAQRALRQALALAGDLLIS